MHIRIISVTPTDKPDRLKVRARIVAPKVGARLWVELQFQPSGGDPWAQAYDRVVQLLDVA